MSTDILHQTARQSPPPLRLCADSDRDSDEGVDHPASQQLEGSFSSRHVSYPYK